MGIVRCPRRPSRTGSMRSSSSDAVTSCDSGRVDSPPKSSKSAPAKLQCHRMLGCTPSVEKFAAVRKTVRRNVKYTHHEGARRQLQPESFSAKHARSSFAQAAYARSERKPLREYPAMVVGMKRGGCDLHARG